MGVRKKRQHSAQRAKRFPRCTGMRHEKSVWRSCRPMWLRGFCGWWGGSRWTLNLKKRRGRRRRPCRAYVRALLRVLPEAVEKDFRPEAQVGLEWLQMHGGCGAELEVAQRAVDNFVARTCKRDSLLGFGLL